MGVMLFFVLSGFFMGRLLFIRQMPLGTFFVRRFTRVLPALWLYILVAALYAATFQPITYTVPIDELLSTLFFLRTYIGADTGIWYAKWSIAHLWSLNVEEHSYVYLALIAFISSVVAWRYATLALLLLTVLASIGCALLYLTDAVSDSGISHWRTHTEVAALGLIASATYCVLRERYGFTLLDGHPYLGIGAVLLACLCFAPGRLLDVPRFYLITIVSPILAALAVNHAHEFPQLVRSLLSHQVLRWFGTCSFSIYLWQNPFYSFTKELGMTEKIAGLALSIAVGALSYYCVESPLRRYLNRWWQLRTARRLTAQSCA
jgi:peptidoglycan/LPS O-acetylase OafA/YrhL